MLRKLGGHQAVAVQNEQRLLAPRSIAQSLAQVCDADQVDFCWLRTYA